MESGCKRTAVDKRFSKSKGKGDIKQLEELEYLGTRVGARGKEYAYVMHYQGQAEEATRKCYLNLTPVEEIRKMIKKEKSPGKKG